MRCFEKKPNLQYHRKDKNNHYIDGKIGDHFNENNNKFQAEETACPSYL